MGRYQQVVDLHQENVSQREIARRLNLQRSTVRKWLSAGCYPERASRRYRRGTDRWADYIRQRWQAGCHNAAQLTAELRPFGFSGSYNMVRRFVRNWRESSGQGSTGRIRSTTRPEDNPRSMAWLLLKPTAERKPDEEGLVKTFCEFCPEIRQAVPLVQEFRRLVRERLADGLDAWLASAGSDDSPKEIQRFAAGITADYSAVKAALSVSWSNGQTEGQVNRLKLIKRQMYGRAKFDLLRQRVLLKIG
jgi:transposase